MTKKGIRHTSSDVGLMFTAFNLRRLMNIIDKNTLKRTWLFIFQNSSSPNQNKAFRLIPIFENSYSVLFFRAANAIGNLKDTHLSDFFKRIAFRKGRTVAVSATARKLGVIIWNMVTKNIPYKPNSQYLFLDEKRKLGIVKRIKKQIAKFDLTNEDIGFKTT